MNIKFFTLLSISVLAGITVCAQELTRKIPGNAQFVITINNKAIVEKSSIALLNETLVKLGAFEKINERNDYPTNTIMELDFNLDKQAYVYRTDADSLYYIGILIPLKANHQVKERMFSKFNSRSSHDGFERRVSKDGKTQVAWDQESLFIMTGSPKSSYFETEEIANLYGLDLERYDELYSPDTVLVAEEAWATAEEIVVADTIDTTEWESAAEEIVDETQEWDSYSDSTELDSYDLATDSIYLANLAREAKNDSIRNDVFVNWLAKDFANYINPSNNLANHKSIKIKDQNILLRFWIANVDNLYREAYADNMLYSIFGTDLKDIKYGYEDATIDLIQHEHSLKIAGSVHIDEDLTHIFKALHKNNINKKFAQYIPENHLAYASMNISTEGYLKQLPSLLKLSYAPLVGEYADVLQIVATALEIGLDEKSIAKVLKGDNVFFLNDLQKVSKEYLTYEYDDDYNYTEVMKTKEEYSPNFLWMFTSEDQRLFQKTLEFAIKKEKVELDEDIYTIHATKDTEAMYVVFKKDIVFVGNNFEQISAIQKNRFKTGNDPKVKKDIFTHPFNFVINTSSIPEVIHKLEIPVAASWDPTLQNLSDYGKLQIRYNKLSKNRISGEMSLELPKKDSNALQYILKQVIQNVGNTSSN
ncbi:hypothetical protein [Sphingobacterium bovistauri]|uniref:Histone acetyl transferase HAT1 N-terminal domain-containing protein n=1 Tax=Sphingobacterium bovistauri TaxID=2781959 RepID=A0ABS7Z2H5_9SPHI|nr:hypothetical protein [Sphingobacterium bovistauri]MCA5004188.1 hypothetical protein [Sphingobacterium bovistauri]